MLSENMLLRYFVKCWVKFVTKFSMRTPKCNTKKYLQLDAWIDLRLTNAVEGKLDGIFHRHDVEHATWKTRHRRVQR